jgi:hypothetical protein
MSCVVRQPSSTTDPSRAETIDTCESSERATAHSKTGRVSLWYHGTRLANVESIRESGLRKGKGPSDMASNGAIYLNPDIDDCRQLCRDKSIKTGHKYVMLVFEFNPQQVSHNYIIVGSYPTWWKLVAERRMRRSKTDWLFTYQSRNPARSAKKNAKHRVRRMNNGERAEQLIIFSQRMGEQMNRYLIEEIPVDDNGYVQNERSNAANGSEARQRVNARPAPQRNTDRSRATTKSKRKTRVKQSIEREVEEWTDELQSHDDTDADEDINENRTETQTSVD